MPELSLFKNALAFDGVAAYLQVADLDSDGQPELVCASREGFLNIFKWPTADITAEEPCIVATHDLQGWVTTLATGDVLNRRHHPTFLLITDDGLLYVFMVKERFDCESLQTLQYEHYQRLQANITYAIVYDIDRDHEKELVVCLTDRVVRSYRYTPASSRNSSGDCFVPLTKWECPGLITGVSFVSSDGPIGLLLSQAERGFIHINLEAKADADTEQETIHFTYRDVGANCVILHRKADDVFTYSHAVFTSAMATEFLSAGATKDHLSMNFPVAIGIRVVFIERKRYFLACDNFGKVFFYPAEGTGSATAFCSLGMPVTRWTASVFGRYVVLLFYVPVLSSVICCVASAEGW